MYAALLQNHIGTDTIVIYRQPYPLPGERRHASRPYSALGHLAKAVAALRFGVAPIIPRWLTWLSDTLFFEPTLKTIPDFGRDGSIAPGGTMNVYLLGAIGFLWV